MKTEKLENKTGGNDFLPLRPHTLISLWDMKQFLIHHFRENWEHIGIIAQKLEIAAHSKIGGHKLTPQKLAQFRSQFIPLSFGFICQHLQLKHTLRQAEILEADLDKEDCTYQTINAQLKTLIITASDEINDVTFAFIPHEKAKFFEKDDLFGKAVNKAFPDARDEIEDAGNCLAADLNTAAVFHLMRVVELGLRDLALRLKVKNLNKKSKQIKIPIELGTWDEIINTLQTKLDGFRVLTRSPSRERKIEFCNELLKELRSIKDLWRNKVMHTRASYDSKQAESAFEHVRNFMQKLATAEKI